MNTYGKPMRQLSRVLGVCALLLMPLSGLAADRTPDAAAAFGARPLADVDLSPDGKLLAFILPQAGARAALYTMALDGTPERHLALSDDGQMQLASCEWVSNTRLACRLTGPHQLGAIGDKGVSSVNYFKYASESRVIAVDADGKNAKLLSVPENAYQRGVPLNGGEVIDASGGDGVVLMARSYLVDQHAGSHIGKGQGGLAAERVDTRTLTTTQVVPLDIDTFRYLTDGHGIVRILGQVDRDNARRENTGVDRFLFRSGESGKWQHLSTYNEITHTGLMPLSVEPAHNTAYGLKDLDGRLALYSVSLDEQRHEELVFQLPGRDVSGVAMLGPNRLPVGALYEDEEKGDVHYFDADLAQVRNALQKALPGQAITFVDASADLERLAVRAASDANPGRFYLFDRKTKQLRPLLNAREELAEEAPAPVQAVQFPAADGTILSGYLTLPPGESNPKGRAAIIIPRTEQTRDGSRFQWLAQFYASRGFVVLQTSFRGPTPYAGGWFESHGFKSWRTATGDVLDGARWLTTQGMADPGKLAVLGWSYGGYTALQSAVAGPGIFKAVVAIDAISDLAAFVEQRRGTSNFDLYTTTLVGEGPQLKEGSPIENAARIKAPVLLVHGEADSTVSVVQSANLTSRLNSTGGHAELLTFPGLDQNLADSAARAQMLSRSEEFLRKALGL